MKAIVQNDYGSPDLHALAEVAQPAMKDNKVLVRVQAASTSAQRSSLRPLLVIRFSMCSLPLSCTPAPRPA